MANPLTGAMQAVGSGARAAADSIMSMKNIMTPFNSLKKDIQSIAKSSRQTSANISKLTKVMLNANKRSFMEIEEARERFKEESKRWDTLFDYLEKIVKGMTGLGKPDKGSSLLDLLKNALKGLGNWLLAGASALAGYLLNKIRDWWKGEKKEAAKEREREKAKEKQEREREKQKEQREREKDRKGRSAQSEEELKRKAEESRRAAEEARRNAENARTEAEKARQAAEEARTEAAREQAKAEESRSRRVADEFDKRAETAKAEADALEREAAERQQKAADTQNEAAEKQNKAADKNTETKGAETKGPETKPGSETKVGPEAKPGPKVKTETKGAEAKPAEGPIPEAKSGPEVTTEAFNVEAEKKNVEKMKRQLKALEGQAQGKAGTPEGDAFKQKADEFRQKISESEAKIAQAESGTKPKAEAPKAEAPKAEAPKAEAPKAEAPRTESARPSEAPKAEAPRTESAGVSETPKAETSTAKAGSKVSRVKQFIAERARAGGGAAMEATTTGRGLLRTAGGAGVFTALDMFDMWMMGEQIEGSDLAESLGKNATMMVGFETLLGAAPSLGPLAAGLLVAGIAGMGLEWVWQKEYKSAFTDAIKPHQEEINKLSESQNPADREKLLAYMAYVGDYAQVAKSNAIGATGYAMAQGYAQGQAGPAPEPTPFPVIEDYLPGGSKNEGAVNAGLFAALKDQITLDIVSQNIKYYQETQPGFLGSLVEGATFTDWWSGTAREDFAKKLDPYLDSLSEQDKSLVEEIGGGIDLTKQGLIANFDRLKPEDFNKLRYDLDPQYRKQIEQEVEDMGGAAAFASGGIVTAETKATIGEAGAEAVLPLQGRYARDSASLIGQGLLMPLIEWGKNNIGMDLYNASANTTPSPIVVMADNKKISTTNVTGGRGVGGSRPEFNSGPTVVGFEQLFANMIAHYAKGAKV